MGRKKVAGLVAGILVALAALAGCTSDAETVSRNLSTEADQFNVERKIVAVSTETDTVLFEVTGLCSITRDGDLVIICREGPDQYVKHFVGLGSQVAWISTQLRTLDVDRYRTKVVFKPTSIVPDVDLSVGQR
jgi:hypothetical protein